MSGAVTEIAIKKLQLQHWPEVARIYGQGIATGDATFETEIPTWESWNSSHLAEHRFIATSSGKVVGWVAIAPVSERCVYGGVVESSVYVSAEAQGTGVGTSLLECLIESTERAGIWTIQAGMFPENVGSVRLHQRAGFEIVGRRKRLGKLNGEWRDVLLTERRSDAVS